MTSTMLRGNYNNGNGVVGLESPIRRVQLHEMNNDTHNKPQLPRGDLTQPIISIMSNIFQILSGEYIPSDSNAHQQQKQPQQQRKLDEVDYWRKKAGWYDDDVSMSQYNAGAMNGDDDYIPSSSKSSSKSHRGVKYVMSDFMTACSQIFGALFTLLVIIMVMRVIGKKKRSITSRNSKRKKGSSGRSRSKSRARSKSRSRSKSKKRSSKGDDDYELMEDRSQRSSRSGKSSRSKSSKRSSRSRSKSRNRPENMLV